MKGLISFFDILGYRSFLENNSAIETAEEVLDFIASAGDETSKALNMGAHAKVRTELEDSIHKANNWIVFSDTIVQTFRTDIPDSSVSRSISLSTAVLCAAALSLRMFMYGLPVRGALHVGDFISHKHCLAGKGIVETYELTEKLDFAGVVFSAEFLNELKVADEEDGGEMMKVLKKYIIEYLVPFSDGTEKMMSVLNFNPRFKKTKSLFEVREIDQIVREKFWAFKKTIPSKVEGKVENTVKLLRFFHYLRNDTAH